jgi:hypothetical protein
MSRIGKSIYGRVKQIQSFEPTVCPIIVNGENGADGNAKLSFYNSVALHMSAERIINSQSRKT